MEKERIEEAKIEEPQDPPRSSWVLVGQFFVVPIFIVGLCVGVFILFGLITGETRTPRDYLEEVKSGKGSRRWQAAFELSKYLTQKGSVARDPRFASSLSTAFQGARQDDPRIRQYLALAMGRLGDPVAVEPLIAALDDNDESTRLFVVWALGELGDSRALEPLLLLLQGPDPALRKMVAYSLGRLGKAEAVPSLKTALHDDQRDVRWNTALALARLGDRSGLPILHQMLDRNHLQSAEEIHPTQTSEALLNAIRAVALLRDSSSRSLLERLRDDDDVKVAAAAIEALKTMAAWK